MGCQADDEGQAYEGRPEESESQEAKEGNAKKLRQNSNDFTGDGNRAHAQMAQVVRRGEAHEIFEGAGHEQRGGRSSAGIARGV